MTSGITDPTEWQEMGLHRLVEAVRNYWRVLRRGKFREADRTFFCTLHGAATGNGVADETMAFKEAMDRANQVRVPKPGTFLFSQTFILPEGVSLFFSDGP